MIVAEQLGVYLAYLLRLWPVTDQGMWRWRASLENAHTNESCSFASLDGLFDYLRARTGAMSGPEGTEQARDADEPM